MAGFQVGDRARVKDRPGGPGGYKIAGWEGEIVEANGTIAYNDKGLTE